MTELAAARPQRTVLYVDDQPVNVLVMRGIFTHVPDCHLVVAVDGASGLRAAMDCDPDLLLLDIGLPDCQGQELLARIRTVPCRSSVPAVAVTADITFDPRGTSFCEVWTKPLAVHQTLADLDRLLSGPPTTRHAALRAAC